MTGDLAQWAALAGEACGRAAAVIMLAIPAAVITAVAVAETARLARLARRVRERREWAAFVAGHPDVDLITVTETEGNDHG